MSIKAILTVVNVSNSERYREIRNKMDVMHGIISRSFSAKEIKKLFQCDNDQKEIRILSEELPNKEHIAEELNITLNDIHSYDYTSRLHKLNNGSTHSFMFIGNPVCKKKGKRMPIKAIEGCKDWFISRSDKHGFVVKNLELSTLYPYLGKESTYLNTVQYTGVLEVRDEDLFKKTIMQGIGYEKCFGFGLLYVI